jgi:hypothetical protein
MSVNARRDRHCEREPRQSRGTPDALYGRWIAGRHSPSKDGRLSTPYGLLTMTVHPSAALRVVAEILAQRFPREPLRLALLASVEEFAQFVDEGVAT